MKPNSKRPISKGIVPAFTLVELLVVIAIITILMAAGAASISGVAGKGVTSAVETAEALFDEARIIAQGKNLRSAVLVSKKMTNSPADDLRRIIVVHEKTKTDGTAEDPNSSNPKWVVTSRGAVLPDQVFFSQEFSKKNHKNSSGSLDTVSKGDIDGVKKAYEGEYFIYKFTPQGLIDPNLQGASFVVGSGVRNSAQSADSQPPKAVKGSLKDFGGFVIWRNGSTSRFRSPAQIGADKLSAGSKF